MEVLTTLLVILTIIQPFICLHPVIIWSQDSQHNSMFLILIILIWFLPLGIHTVTRSILNQGVQKCTQEKVEEDQMFQRTKNVPKKIQPKVDTGLRRSHPKIKVMIKLKDRTKEILKKRQRKIAHVFLHSRAYHFKWGYSFYPQLGFQ